MQVMSGNKFRACSFSIRRWGPIASQYIATFTLAFQTGFKLVYGSCVNAPNVLWKLLSVNHIMMRFGQTSLNLNQFETGLSSSVNGSCVILTQMSLLTLTITHNYSWWLTITHDYSHSQLFMITHNYSRLFWLLTITHNYSRLLSYSVTHDYSQLLMTTRGYSWLLTITHYSQSLPITHNYSQLLMITHDYDPTIFCTHVLVWIFLFFTALLRLSLIVTCAQRRRRDTSATDADQSADTFGKLSVFNRLRKRQLFLPFLFGP